MGHLDRYQNHLDAKDSQRRAPGRDQGQGTPSSRNKILQARRQEPRKGPGAMKDDAELGAEVLEHNGGIEGALGFIVRKLYEKGLLSHGLGGRR